MLKFLDYEANDHEGIYEDSMFKAIKDFQKKNNLDVDGIIGHNTINLVQNFFLLKFG